MNKKAGFALTAMVALTYIFLYMPIFVLIFYSFNANPFTQHWTGFTLQWYALLFESVEIQHALFNSFIVALVTTAMSLLFGTLFVVYAHQKYSVRLLSLFYSILGIPEIVIAVSLLQFFSYLQIQLGFTTLIGGHMLLGLAYIIPILHTRFGEIDKHLVEVAYDLGATDTQVFFTILLPLLTPGIIASGFLVFILSLDDFLISFFCAGPTVQTLPLFIFSTIRSGSTPMINALSTILLLVSCVCVLIFSLLQKTQKEKL
jgi:spermidine/putrescine transport system permease protein